jgi:hypothetical protein
MKKAFLLLPYHLLNTTSSVAVGTDALLFGYVPRESPKMSHEEVEASLSSGLYNNDRGITIISSII